MTFFPFTAVVGLELAKKSLIYHAIDPRIGGTLFLGHRGCAKSTLVRGFAGILALSTQGRAPFVELPLGTTEDRLLGSVDAQTLVDQGRWQQRSGLIEEANGGILYVDEINLLPDHLADLILDSAASGQHRMERDGMTRQISARYILVGTMNPEEGDLRPQLSDRLAHSVQVDDQFTPDERVEIVRRRMRFDDDPEQFQNEFAASTQELVARISQVRTGLSKIEITPEIRLAVAHRAAEIKLEGMRAELAVLRTARCAAGWNNRASVEQGDVDEAWELCLNHRQSDRSSGEPIQGKTPAQSATKNPVQPPSQHRSGLEPRRAQPDVIPVRPLEIGMHGQLLDWCLTPTSRTTYSLARNQAQISAESSRNPICWLSTLAQSFRNGWRPVRPGLRLLRALPSKRRSLWCFLDASRSTGASHFVSAARDCLAALGHNAVATRFNLLLLDQHGYRWLNRRATATRFQSQLSRIQNAGGKSLLTPALRLLHRHRLRSGCSKGDKIIVCSDGLATPASNEKPGQSWRSLRQIVQQMSQNQAHIAWVHPSPKRGLTRWLDRICDSPRLRRFQV